METVPGEELKNKFISFFNAYYLDAINEMYISYPKRRSVLIDIKDLQKFDIDLANELVNNPDATIAAANSAIASMNPQSEAKEPVYARFFGTERDDMLIQNIGSRHIGKLLTIDSLVVKRSEIIPKVRIGLFKCSFCGATVKVAIENNEVPETCPQCKRKSLKQINEGSEFTDMQRIAVQDPLEKLKGGMPTWQLEIWLSDDMVNTLIPGDRAAITGILRIRPRYSFRKKEEKSLFTMFFDAVSIVPKQKEFAEIEVSAEEEKEILELAKDPHIIEKITASISPSIYGHEEIKRALAFQLFGGTPGKTLIDGGIIRSDIHILLIGDPGSAKTRLLQAVSGIVPKGIYVSGKAATSAGLTASAERDEFSEGGWTLRAGALVLGSGGEVSIDEFDKISDEDKSSLLEALESQTISIAKAGIVAKFSAKASVLAAANPKFGRFDTNMYPAEQFDIPPTLLSRFDLIFPIMDVLDEEHDKKIAEHILIQHEAAGAKILEIEGYEQIAEPPIPQDLLRKYIAYAKQHIKPLLTSEASKKIEEFYISLRKLGIKQGAVPITPRQIEGLVRLAEASAKARLSEKVEESDAENAISLVEYMLRTLAVDRGGRFDIDTLITGMPREKVKKINAIIEIIKKLEEEEGGGAKIGSVLDEAEKNGIDRATATRYINELERSGDIYTPKPGVIKIVRHEEE
ncbi:MAG: minichromosome maintenance protein MCM [Candidatus Micrarchaeaceae archaeon]